MDRLNKSYLQILLALYALKVIIIPQITISDALIILFLASSVILREFFVKKQEKDEILEKMNNLVTGTNLQLEKINSKILELEEIKKHMSTITSAGKIQSSLARF